MKANEFIKEHGLDTFKISMSFINTKKFLVVYDEEIDFTDEIKPHHGNCVFDRKEVKRLVEAHEFIDYLGGLEKAKRACSIDLERLQQAITDVESCQPEQDIEQWIDEGRACGESGWSKYDDPVGEWLKEDRGDTNA